MSRFIRNGASFILSALIVLCALNGAWAAYEIENVQASVPTGAMPQQGPSEDLTVQWDKPAFGTGDSLIQYVYIWNHSATPLDDTQLNNTTNDDTVPDLATPYLTKAKEDFASDDYDTLWYVHIKTVYFSQTLGEELSNDSVLVFNFDNVDPTGTIALDPNATGQTSTTSSVNPVTLDLTATADTATVYLSNTTTRPQTGNGFQASLTHEVTEGVGQKTIYVWFEDVAGNVSPVGTLTFELIAGKSVDPTGNFPLELGSTQTFTILGKGASETFDWEIINPNPANVASFSGNSTDVASVDVVGDNEGTFQVRATSNDDAAVYDSGTVTVRESTLQKIFDLVTTATTNINLIGFVLDDTGYMKASDLLAAIPNCDTIWNWNVTNQGVDSYSSGQPPFRDFDLELGKAYLVNVTADVQFTLEGKAPASLSIGLFTTSTTNLNYIALPNHQSGLSKASELLTSIPNSDTVWRWNAQNQGLDSYSAGQPPFRDFDITWGEGFIVNVLSDGLW